MTLCFSYFSVLSTIGLSEMPKKEARSMKQTVNLGETFLWTSFSFNWSKFFVKCFLNLSSDAWIYSYFERIMSGSCKSSTFILVMELNISIYFLNCRDTKYDKVNNALLYYYDINDIFFWRSRIYFCL